MTDYFSFELLDIRPARIFDATETVENFASVLSSAAGGFEVTWLSIEHPWERPFNWVCYSREDIANLRIFLTRRQGRFVPFWAPTWAADFLLLSPAAANASAFTVSDSGRDAIREYLIFITPTALYPRKLLSYTDNMNGTRTLTVTPSIPVALDVDNVLISYLSLARLSEDSLEMDFPAMDYCDFVFNYIEVPYGTQSSSSLIVTGSMASRIGGVSGAFDAPVLPSCNSGLTGLAQAGTAQDFCSFELGTTGFAAWLSTTPPPTVTIGVDQATPNSIGFVSANGGHNTALAVKLASDGPTNSFGFQTYSNSLTGSEDRWFRVRFQLTASLFGGVNSELQLLEVYGTRSLSGKNTICDVTIGIGGWDNLLYINDKMSLTSGSGNHDHYTTTAVPLSDIATGTPREMVVHAWADGSNYRVKVWLGDAWGALTLIFNVTRSRPTGTGAQPFWTNNADPFPFMNMFDTVSATKNLHLIEYEPVDGIAHSDPFGLGI